VVFLPALPYQPFPLKVSTFVKPQLRRAFGPAFLFIALGLTDRLSSFSFVASVSH
jgi:hypothetical protein